MGRERPQVQGLVCTTGVEDSEDTQWVYRQRKTGTKEPGTDGYEYRGGKRVGK